MVEDFVGVAEPDRFDLRHGFFGPLRGRVLRVAIGERDGVPLLVQPGGQVNGERRFADAAFGICDYDNHVSDHIPPADMLASNMCGRLTVGM